MVPRCAGCMKLSIEEACKIAINRGGECLSSTYINGRPHLKWECKYNHEWMAALNKIKHSDRWYPFCAGNMKLTIDDDRRIASEKGVGVYPMYTLIVMLH